MYGRVWFSETLGFLASGVVSGQPTADQKNSRKSWTVLDLFLLIPENADPIKLWSLRSAREYDIAFAFLLQYVDTEMLITNK